MKILIHAHTTYSDYGTLTPRELAITARTHGFEAVFITDDFEGLDQHRFAKLVADCNSVADCLLIPGYERTFRGYDVVALGVDRWVEGNSVFGWCNQVRSAGGITAVAHPVRYDHRIPDDILESVDAVEVWNSRLTYDGILGPNPNAYRLLGKERYPLCSQDLHGSHPSAVGMELNHRCTSRGEIIACLRQGKYRMTNGFVSYGANLSDLSQVVLSAYHLTRRQAIKAAQRLRASMAFFSIPSELPKPTGKQTGEQNSTGAAAPHPPAERFSRR
jgi:hypothetical protein